MNLYVRVPKQKNWHNFLPRICHEIWIVNGTNERKKQTMVCARRDSNPDLRIRNPLFCPLNYERL